MTVFRHFILAIASSLVLVSCAGGDSFKDVPSGASLAAPDPVHTEVRQDYQLNPDDVVEINVFDVASLNRTVQLDATGTINLPLIGQVVAAGQTARQLGQTLQTRYGEKYLKNPQISVLVKQMRVETIVVDGAVQAPGVFPATAKMSLIRAIAMAKGVDALGNPREVVVFRMVNNERVAGVFNLTDIRAGKAIDPPIYPNDTIVVASSAMRRTLRDIVGLTPIVGLLPLVVP